jgi:sirohydrochlorin ferrochelatase
VTSPTHEDVVGTVLLAHGSSAEEQVPVLNAIAEAIQSSDTAPTPGCRTAFLDHHGPSLDEAVTALVAQGATSIVVVPALLSNAFHARYDVPRAVGNASRRCKVPVHVADPIGLDDRLGPVVNQRVAALDIDDIDTVVVASAGTGVAAAREDFRRAVRQWRGRADWRLNAAYIAGGAPSAAELVTTLVDQNQRVVVMPFLLADGQLRRRLERDALEAGALALTEVLGPDPILATIAKERRDACARV